ncbi:MAG: hypothetical protein LBC39_03205 [Methanobrevibacter sp.]|nr:hypothetical protein [Candidatus Methanovirga aequatorialis]
MKYDLSKRMDVLDGRVIKIETNHLKHIESDIKLIKQQYKIIIAILVAILASFIENIMFRIIF